MAGEQTYISWNATNWITVVLMAAIFFAFLGLVMKFVQSRREEATA